MCLSTLVDSGELGYHTDLARIRGSDLVPTKKNPAVFDYNPVCIRRSDLVPTDSTGSDYNPVGIRASDPIPTKHCWILSKFHTYGNLR